MIVDKIKHDSRTARRNGPKEEAVFLVTLYSEVAMVGKNKGNRETTDLEAMLVMKRFLKGTEEVIAALGLESTDYRVTKALNEQTMLNRYLPSQLPVEELRQTITDIVTNLFPEKNPKQFGNIMKHLKTNYDGRYDGAVATTIVRSIIESQ